MGELFLAQQQGIAGFAKKLAVKRIKPALAGDATFVEMFLAEGRVAALIDHPNVVHIHELGKVEGQYFIAMEYVEGLSLARVMELTGGRLELATAVYIASQVCEGLAYAHDACGLDGQPLGLVHRDVSPPNILLGTSGCVKISDFGVAKVQHHAQTGAGMLKGKFAYLSPEQARGEPVDRRSDLYALGLVLFEMTVGTRANPGTSDTGMVFAATKGELPDPVELVPDYPPALRAIFRKATALEPAARYQQAKELQEDLLAFQVEERLALSAGRIGAWVRSLVGAEEDLPAGGDTPVTATGPGAPARIAYEPTQAAPQETPARRFEVDLERELEPDGAGERSTRRAGRGLPIVAAIILLGLLAGGAFLLQRVRAPAAVPAAATPATGARDVEAPVREAGASDAGHGVPRHARRKPGAPHAKTDDSGAARAAAIRAAMLHDARVVATDGARPARRATTVDAGAAR